MRKTRSRPSQAQRNRQRRDHHGRLGSGLQRHASAGHEWGRDRRRIARESNSKRHHSNLDGRQWLDFGWNQLGNGQPMGIFATYFSNVKLSHNRINNTLRGIGLMEDGNVALLDTNTYTGNHEDSEHWGESYNAGDVVSNVTSQNARLNGYSDDGIAVVGGNMPCTTNQSTPGGPVENSQIIHPTIVGSRNSGGSKIHTCAIQLACNLNGANVQSPDIAKPALCSIQIMDYFGGGAAECTNRRRTRRGGVGNLFQRRPDRSTHRHQQRSRSKQSVLAGLPHDARRQRVDLRHGPRHGSAEGNRTAHWRALLLQQCGRRLFQRGRLRQSAQHHWQQVPQRSWCHGTLWPLC